MHDPLTYYRESEWLFTFKCSTAYSMAAPVPEYLVWNKKASQTLRVEIIKVYVYDIPSLYIWIPLLLRDINQTLNRQSKTLS